MASIARKNLFEDLPRFIAAQAGIMFAVSLVTIQNGILNGFVKSSSLLIDNSSAELWVASADMIHMELTMPLPLEYMVQAREVKGVKRAEALIFRSARWRDPSGQIHAVTVVGSTPEGTLFAPWNIIQGEISSLKEPYGVIIDETNLESLGVTELGDVSTLGGLEARLVGVVEGTQPIINNKLIFTSLKNANAYVNARLETSTRCKLEDGDLKCVNIFDDTNPAEKQVISSAPKQLTLTDPISFVLIEVAPGQDIDELRQRLEETLPNVKTYTGEEMSERTQSYWKQRTGIGFILSLGAGVGILVGMIVVAQILYASVSDHLKEFGTLKAMGAPDKVIYSVILEQSLWMALLGYIPGMALCMGVTNWASATQGILILITPTSAVMVFGLTVIMCAGSAIFAIQKVTQVDPAIVFKA
ncbi:ftsX-like permease family protein [Lyngbya aestuarii BL J]|uniref:FtsX-like permease family protein n=1 Tax=Lyngbya aestuarii BL J TaxID=1348334 RepID=U7QI87_9CYAN|nr:FtsX-like permease family protein [Lyngbya aestuarii]ERT06141.1 ftsX-like permease family protein [Lyngbya aestuarii BL J]